MAESLRGVHAWVATQDEPARVVLRCASDLRPVDDDGAATIRLGGCAAELAHHEVVELVVLGAPAVTIDLRGCAHPDAAHEHLVPLVDRLQQTGIHSVQVLPDPGERPRDPAGTDQQADAGDPVARDRHRVTPAVLDAGHMPRTRRQALLLAPSALPDEELRPHERLRDAVLALAPPGAAARAAAPAPVLGAAGCDTCGVCVRACPLDALSINEVPAGGGLSITTLVHLPAACDGCSRCVELCPPGVLHAEGSHTWQVVQDEVTVPVHTVVTRRCARCRSRMPAGSSGPRCAPCEQRQRNPFAASWPPHLRPAP